MTTEPALSNIPALLLEGDEPSSRPGAEVAENPKADPRLEAVSEHAAPAKPEATPGPAPAGPSDKPVPEPQELPQTYGTGKLMLVARDPHCLYTHWDISPEEQSRYNQLAAAHHLVVRVHPGNAAAPPANEIHAHPESRHCFIPVGQAATTYVAELGYYESGGQWKSITASPPVATPPDAVSEDKTLQFASIPGRTAESAVPTAEPTPTAILASARAEAPARIFPSLHPPRVGWLPALDEGIAGSFERAFTIREPVTPEFPLQATPWTAEDELAFVEFATLVRRRQRSFDSLALVEFLRSQTAVETPSSPGISSPVGGEQPPLPGFWFQVNAELIVYGATEPSANVTIAGRPIQLRSDGTFSCRFALPDGAHQLPVAAVSSRGDYRQAELNFTRRTDYRAHSADEAADAVAPAETPPLLEL